MIRVRSNGCRRFVGAFLLMLPVACATLPPPAVPDQEVRASLGKVAIVAGSGLLSIDSDSIQNARSKGGEALLSCLVRAGSGGCHGVMCGPVMVVVLGVCGLVGSVVAISDSTSSEGAVLLAGSEAAFKAAVDAHAVQRPLPLATRKSATAAGVSVVNIPQGLAQSAADSKDYRVLVKSGVDTVIETTLLKISTSVSESRGRVRLRVEARMRLVRTRDNAEIFANQYVFISESRRYADWVAQGNAALITALTRAHTELATLMVENAAMLHPFPYQAARSIGFLTHAFGLAPEYPGTRFHLVTGGGIGETAEWVRVDSVRPTLQWESFPREVDRDAAPSEMNRVRKVMYDLVIARADDYVPGEVVYRRTGINSNAHQLTEPLTAGAKYYWTVRARFELDGRMQLTEWATLNVDARAAISVPNIHSYRFAVAE